MLLTLLATAIAGKQIISETIEPKAPATQRFDWDKYYEDVEKGVDCMEIVRRRKKGYYDTNIPPLKKKPREIIKGVSESKYEEYLYDKRVLGECCAENCRQLGFYK